MLMVAQRWFVFNGKILEVKMNNIMAHILRDVWAELNKGGY